jgi:hypothetical protein
MCGPQALDVLVLTIAGLLASAVPPRDLVLALQALASRGNQFCWIASQSTRDLEEDRQGRHVLAALDLAHMRAFDASQVGQRFLGDALCGSLGSYHRTEGLGQFGIEGGRANRSAALDGSLLHGQKRLFTA